MIVFCTHCWRPCDSSDPICPNCKADLALDPRPYNEKLVSALEHPLPEARVRACWLVWLNSVNKAVGKLIVMADRDADLFVRIAAVQALGKLHSQEAVPLLERLADHEDRWIRTEARKSLKQIKGTDSAN